ncbi:MAG: asparagine synthase-related protein [Gemmatimonadota bacterium]
MATLFGAFPQSGGGAVLPEDVRHSVTVAMRERCPGNIREHRAGNVLCLIGGVDGHVSDSRDHFVMVDGRAGLGAREPAVAGTPLDELARVWGDQGASILPDLQGSFALCAFDHRSQEITLVRDRFGSRPLFWLVWDDVAYVASECKVLAALGVVLNIDERALREMIVARWLVGEHHLLSPIAQVPAAFCVRLGGSGMSPVVRQYWRLPFAPESVHATSMESFRDQARVALRASIDSIVEGRERVGILLSGGIDSSVIAGVASETTARCIAFVGRLPDSDNIEMHRAIEVAEHLGMQSVVVDVTVASLDDRVRSMVRRVEQCPRHANNLVLAQLLEAAAGHVDVVMHGDGAEVLFGLADSRRVGQFTRKHALFDCIPAAVRRTAARRLRAFESERAWRLAQVLDCTPVSFASLLDRVLYTPGVARVLLDVVGRDAHGLLPMQHFSDYADDADALQSYQANTFLASSLLRHDRLSQPLGLTTAAPFLEAPVVALACRLPRELRYVNGSKPVLRALCDLYYPPHVSRWSKRGFEVPWEQWMSETFEQITVCDEVAGLLPAGFVRAAIVERDPEALWLIHTLGILLDSFGVPTSPAASERWAVAS